MLTYVHTKGTGINYKKSTYFMSKQLLTTPIQIDGDGMDKQMGREGRKQLLESHHAINVW